MNGSNGKEAEMTTSNSDQSQQPLKHVYSFGYHPLTIISGGVFTGFLALNAVILMSLPPVLRQRGAPYLPTFQKNLDAMFSQLKREVQLLKHNKPKLKFVDLGSGDGRVVFRAAREDIFDKSVGYEINIILHAWAQSRRLVQGQRYWSRTNFYWADIWTVDLTNADVVAVYGLSPIMTELGKKLKAELKPGSIVLSNIFEIPGWTPSATSPVGTHIYITPQCWQER